MCFQVYLQNEVKKRKKESTLEKKVLVEFHVKTNKYDWLARGHVRAHKINSHNCASPSLLVNPNAAKASCFTLNNYI